MSVRYHFSFARRLMAVLFTTILLVGCATAPGPKKNQHAQIDGAISAIDVKVPQMPVQERRTNGAARYNVRP